MARSYYDVLGVSRDADEATIKKAFRKLARENHPDHHPNDPKAAERLKEINHAYSILSDGEKRKLYEEYGEDAERVGFDPARAAEAKRWQQSGGFGGFDGLNVDDLLSGMFGGGRRGPGRAGGRNRTVRMTIDFTTAVLGGERTLQLDGESIHVRIPAGVSSGGRLKVRGKGLGNGAERGDLLIEIEVASDPLFERDGDDLLVEVPITLGEALRGGHVEVPTLTTPVRVRVPPGTQPGRRLRVKGRGVAAPHRAAGDLIVTLRVVLPEIDADAAQAIDTLERLYREDVRADLRSRMN